MLQTSVRFTLLASIFAAACGPGPAGSSETDTNAGSSSNGGDTTGMNVTTSTSVGAESESTTLEPSTSLGATDDGTTTGPGEPVVYVGEWSTGFGYTYFTACGENDSWYALGLPGYEYCSDVDSLWLRVTGVLLPPEPGTATPRLEIVEIHEGPCTEGSCDGSVPIGGECGDFDELCLGSKYTDCDLVAQDCPSDYKCAPRSWDGDMEWNGTLCIALAPMTVAVGDACTMEHSPWSGVDDCAFGSMCWDVDPVTGLGECAALCDLQAAPGSECAVGTTCTAFLSGPAAEAYAVGVCVPE